MDSISADRIRANPAFIRLERRRSAFSWTLTAVILAVYFGFILLVAFAPGVMAMRVTPSISLGFPLGLGVIVVAVALTGLYVVRANGEFDRLTREVVSGAGSDAAVPLGAPGLAHAGLGRTSLAQGLGGVP